MTKLLAAWLIGLPAICGQLAGPATAADSVESTLEIVIEPLPEAPYEGEMVLLAVRGFYRGTITRYEFEHPETQDFGWMQLGRDSWADDSSRGRQARTFERRIAVFPQRSGRLEVPSFVHRLTLLDERGRRTELEVRSAPVVFEVRPKPDGEGWWLPARSIEVTEQWDRPPEMLGLGELAHRSVTLEVEGVGPEQLPPTPALKASGLVAFADPEERSTRLTPDGPVSSVTWHWTVKPISDATSTIEAVTIPWFDTRAREPRELVIPARQIGLAAAALAEGRRSLAERLVLPGGVLAGFGLGLLLLLPGLRLRTRSEIGRLLGRLGFSPDPAARALRQAAQRGDPAATRIAAYRLLGAGHAPDRPRTLPGTVADELSRLDRLLFGPPSEQDGPDLRALARGLLRARRWLG